MSSATALGLAVLGAGPWGRNHIRALARLPGVDVVAIADPDESARAAGLALAPTARGYVEAMAAIAADGVDAVVIATPSSTHARLALAALAAGRHVLVEKPAAHTLVDARAIAAAAGERVVLVGHLMLYHPAVERLRTLVGDGTLGEVRYVSSVRANWGRFRTDENVVWSLAPHDLAMCRAVMGADPQNVAARATRSMGGPVEDLAFLSLGYPSGALGHVHVSWVDAEKRRRLVVVGERCTVEFDDMGAAPLRIFDRPYEAPPSFAHFDEYLSMPHAQVLIPTVAMEEPLLRMVRHFVAACRGEARPQTPIADGVAVTAALEAASRSLAQGGIPVDLADLNNVP